MSSFMNFSSQDKVVSNEWGLWDDFESWNEPNEFLQRSKQRRLQSTQSICALLNMEEAIAFSFDFFHQHQKQLQFYTALFLFYFPHH